MKRLQYERTSPVLNRTISVGDVFETTPEAGDFSPLTWDFVAHSGRRQLVLQSLALQEQLDIAIAVVWRGTRCPRLLWAQFHTSGIVVAR